MAAGGRSEADPLHRCDPARTQLHLEVSVGGKVSEERELFLLLDWSINIDSGYSWCF